MNLTDLQTKLKDSKETPVTVFFLVTAYDVTENNPLKDIHDHPNALATNMGDYHWINHHLGTVLCRPDVQYTRHGGASIMNGELHSAKAAPEVLAEIFSHSTHPAIAALPERDQRFKHPVAAEKYVRLSTTSPV